MSCLTATACYANDIEVPKTDYESVIKPNVENTETSPQLTLTPINLFKFDALAKASKPKK